MIDLRYKIKILGILDYYKMETEPVSRYHNAFKSYSFQRNIFIESHGKLTKIKVSQTGNLKDTKTTKCKEKEISNMYFVDKEGYDKYTLKGDGIKKDLKYISIYDAKDMGPYQKFVDGYLSETDIDDMMVVYNDDICFIYSNNKLLDVMTNDNNFKGCYLEEIFVPENEIENER